MPPREDQPPRDTTPPHTSAPPQLSPQPDSVPRPRRPDPEPLQADDVRTVALGTAAWTVIALVLVPFHHRLNAHGHLWWLATACCGAGLGLLGLVVTTRRRRRLAGQAHDSRSSSSPDSQLGGSVNRAT